MPFNSELLRVYKVLGENKIGLFAWKSHTQNGGNYSTPWILTLEISLVSLFLMLHMTKPSLKQMLKISAFYLEIQKIFIPKKDMISALVTK